MTHTRTILEMVFAERQSQEARYGGTNDKLESGTGPGTAWLLPYTFDSAQQIQRQVRYDYEDWEAEGQLPTWLHLVREEIAEAFELHEDDPNLVAELVQVAALCVSWVERLTAKADERMVSALERGMPTGLAAQAIYGTKETQQ